MAISTIGVVLTRLAGALYNQQLSNATYNEVLTGFNSAASMNALANYLISTDFASKTDLQIAQTITTNIGVSSVVGIDNWVAAQLTAAGSANKGSKIISLLNDFSNMSATDATYGAAVTAFNTKIDASQALSQTSSNAGGTFAAAGTAGKSFPLTTGVDVFTGGTGDDSFSAVIANVGAANTTGTTMQAGDVLNGGTGTDTLSVSVTGGTAGSTSAVTFTGIEKISVSNVNGAAQTISLALADSSLTTVGNSSSNTGAVTTFTGLSKIVAAEMSNGDGGLTTTYNTSVVSGTADSASLTLSNQTTGGTFTATGIETLNVASNTSANAVTLAAGPTTVNVSGTARLTLGALDAAITTLNASTNSGGLVATLNAATPAVVVTGSSAADTITAGTVLSGAGAVNAGDGTDTLVSTADALIALAADGARFTNFETLSISNTTPIATANRAQDVSLISGVTTLNATQARAHDAGAADTTQNVTFTNLAATTNTINITGLANADTDVADDLSVTVTASRAINTTADAVTVNLGSSTAVSGANAVVGTGVAGQVILDVSLANEESITINSLGAATGTNVIDDLTNTAATSVTLTGARGLTIDSMTSAVVTSINASAMTGAFIMSTANGGSVASTISGGSGADTLLGGSAADNITGGAGNDSISGGNGADVITGDAGNDTLVGQVGIDNLSGGDGNDTFSVALAAHFIGLTSAETVSGGAGNDNLSFSETATAITIAATDLVGINSVETITINGTSGAGSVTLTDAVYTANGATTLAVVDGDLITAGGTLTVNASALTSANSVQITANTVTAGAAVIADSLVGGAGADTFFFAGSNGLNSTDTVTGGAGTDTISLSAAAAVIANLTGVTLVESIVTTGSAADVAITLGSNLVISTTGTLTTNASSLVAGGSIELTYDGSAITTTTKIQNVTGSAGDDIISGGSGADIIVGGDGNDSIVGGVGIDNVSGGAGNDIFAVAGAGAGFVGLTAAETVSGGTGNDTLQFAAGTLVVAASDLVSVSGVETIEIQNIGQTASLTITDAWFTANGTTSLAITATTQDTGATTLAASTMSAANSISLTMSKTDNSAGNVINMGSGNDTLTVDLQALDNTTTLAGGAGTDTLVISANTGSANIAQVAAVTGWETVSFLTAGIAGTFATTVNDAGVAAAATQTINGSNLTGTLLWNGAAELDGKFSITGGAGADSLTGGSLVDTISGGIGADVITGGLGADSLTGGVGADTFVYALVTESNGTNTDTITDFTTGTDKLQVTLNYATLVTSLDINAVRTGAGVAGSSAAQDTLSGQRGQYVYDTTASAVYVNFNADNLLTTADYKINVNAASTATASIVTGDINFAITGGTAGDVIIADGGADTIDGAAGADNITGGAGVDSITGSAGADTITGGAAADRIFLTDAEAVADVVIMTGTTAALIATEAGTSAGATATYAAGSVGETITGFTSAEDKLHFAAALVTNVAGTEVDTLLEIAKLGTVTDVARFVQVTDTAAADNVDTFAGAVTILNALNTAAVAIGDSFIAAMDNDTNTYLYLVKQVSTANTIAAQDVTFIGVVTAITDVANGDFVSF